MYKKYHISWKPTKPGQYVCIHVPFTHTCTTKYHQNMIYLVGLPSVLYERPGQNERSVLNQLFLLFFRCFSVKSAPLFIQKVPLFMKTNKTRSICVYTCTIYTYIHHIHHQIPPKYKIYLVGLPSVLYETPGQNEICVESAVFVAFHVLFIESAVFIQKVPLFMKTNKTRSICVYTCTIYTYMHHHIPKPPKYKIYLVGLPSVLYERPGQNERSVLNQLFLLLFRCFSCAFQKVPLFIQKVPLFMKTNKTRSICVYTCTIYTYMHHQIPPKYDIPSWPSLCTLWKTRSKWEICVESAVLLFFRCFSCAFHEKHHFSYKKCHFSWKQPKPGQYVCIHVPFTHTCTTYTTKYHQNIRYI